MATDLNRLDIIGRQTRDCEQTTVGESTVTKFSIANNYKYKDKESVLFLDCEVWGKLGDVIKNYGGKGKQLSLSGRLHQNSWEDQDGNKRSKIIMRVDFLQLLGGGKSDSGEPVNGDVEDVF